LVRATEEDLPSLDVARGRDRLLAANDVLASARRRTRGRVWIWFAAATLVAALAIGFALRPSSAYTFTLDGKRASIGARVDANEAERRVQFSDGSTFVVSSESSLGVSDVDRRGAVVELTRGKVSVDIVEHAGSRWEVRAGLFTVRVLGTAFEVDWQPESEHFAVNVRRGTVFVTGPMLEPGRSLTAGARCEVDRSQNRLLLEPAQADRYDRMGATASSAAPIVETPSAPADEPPIPEPRTKKGLSRTGDTRRTPSWQSLEQGGRFADALREAERAGLAEIYATGSADELLTLARAARFAGRSDVSARSLSTCRIRFPATREAATAAYLLGRNAPPEQAVKWFSAYLAEEPSGVWAREAAGRLIEAHRASGDVVAARQAAKRYLAQYPTGPHADFARSVLED
jgi:hypothetical protein